MSRRDGAIVAWHEVPGTSAIPKEPSRRVRYASFRLRTDSMIGVMAHSALVSRRFRGSGNGPLHRASSDRSFQEEYSVARPYRTLRYVSVERQVPILLVLIVDLDFFAADRTRTTTTTRTIKKLPHLPRNRARPRSLDFFAASRRRTTTTTRAIRRLPHLPPVMVLVLVGSFELLACA